MQKPKRSEDLSDDVELKWVPDYEGFYAITDAGDVYSYHSGEPYKMSKTDRGNGYLCVKLCLDGDEKVCDIHRLVCLTFHGQPPTKDHEVRHLDGTRTNNCVENLKWGTVSENVEDAIKHGTWCSNLSIDKGEDANSSVLKEGDIIDIKERLNNGETQKEVAKDYDVGRSQIGRIGRGDQWSHVEV